MTSMERDRMIDTAVGLCEKYRNEPALLLEILHDLQETVGYIPEETQPAIAKCLNLAKAEVHGVVSFYHDFRSAPDGNITVKVCRAEACQSMGANRLLEDILARNGLPKTGTSDKGVTIEEVYCLGNCALAPSAMIGERLMGRVTADRLQSAIEGVGA